MMQPTGLNSWRPWPKYRWDSGRPPLSAGVALAWPTGPVLYREGRVEGEITLTETGEGGFGYDSLFYLPAMGKTMAQLTPAEKNGLSHRGVALAALAKDLQERI